MSKIQTPAMEKLRRQKKYDASGTSSTGKEALRRLLKNKMAMIGLAIIVILLLIAVFSELIAPYDYRVQDYTAVMQKPSSAHLFGTDQMGRDIFSRCIVGARYSLPIGIICVLIGTATGGLLGLIAAYFGGKVDNVIMRIIDVVQAIPSVLLCIAIVAILGNGVVQLVIAIAAGSVQGMTKTVRAAIFMVRNNEYVDSSKSIGISDFKIMFKHLLPNAVTMIVVNAVSGVTRNILTISSLSYIGVGLVSPTPEWGVLLSDSKAYMAVAPHMMLFPGLMIAITVVAFNLFANGLRDALDPRLK